MALDKETKAALIDRLEGWELAEFLDLTTEDIIEAYEEEIVLNLEEVLEFAGIKTNEDNDNE